MNKGTGSARPRGRPTLPTGEAKRHALGIRTTAALRDALSKASQASGRSMAQEIEFRLERSFEDERRLEQVLELGFGRHVAALMVIMGLAMREAAAKAEATSPSGKRPWLSNPYVFGQVFNAVQAVLMAIKPNGNPTPALARGTDPLVRSAAQTIGKATADMVCLAIANATTGTEGASWWYVARKWLGNAAAARIKNIGRR